MLWIGDDMRRNNNGFYQFSCSKDGIYITVYSGVEGAANADVKDALFYIDKRNIPDVDVVKLGEAFKKATPEGCTVKVSDSECHPVDEFGLYYISSDGMRTEAVFYPPFEGAHELTKTEILDDITHAGIRNGVDNSVIDEFLNSRIYGKSYVVAVGTKPVNGKEGYVEYKFNTDLKPRPKMNDDGTVDFHSLENVNHVVKGDVVAVLHPEQRGEVGIDVYGRTVRPSSVRHVIFKHGKNLSISEDGLSLVSMVNGHVTLEEDKVFVSDVMEIVDVDNSTGNIKYDGNVNVKGNILAGFTVEAKGDVSVSGIVEGATVIAGGNITLNRGIQGMNRAVIKAGGNIVTKFIEGASLVEAGGNIETDSILHSKVFANGIIKAEGKKGLIIGGEVKSSRMIIAKNIGNTMGTATIVGAGVDPAAKKRVEELKKELEQLGSNKIQLNQLITALRKKQDTEGTLSSEKLELQQKTTRNLLLIEQELINKKKEYSELKEQIIEDDNARIKVSDTIYNGVKLVFGDQFMFIKEKNCHCQYAKDRADIVQLSL